MHVNSVTENWAKHKFMPRTIYGSRPFFASTQMYVCMCVCECGTAMSFAGGDVKSANNIFKLGTMAVRSQKPKAKKKKRQIKQ